MRSNRLGAMLKTRRQWVDLTDKSEQLQPGSRFPEQFTSELIRSVVLFGHPPAERTRHFLPYHQMIDLAGRPLDIVRLTGEAWNKRSVAWYLDHQLDDGKIYCMSVLENFSRADLASANSRRQGLSVSPLLESPDLHQYSDHVSNSCGAGRRPSPRSKIACLHRSC